MVKKIVYCVKKSFTPAIDRVSSSIYLYVDFVIHKKALNCLAYYIS